MFTAILVTRTIVIFREQNLVGVDDRGRFGALSFRRRYSLHQHDLAGIKRTGEIFTQRLSLRRRKFNNLGDLLGDRHAICCNCFNQRSPHHVLFRVHCCVGKSHGAAEGEHNVQKAVYPQGRAVSKSKVCMVRFRCLLKSSCAGPRSGVP